MSFGQHLRALRGEAGLSRAGLARAGLARRAGVPVSTLRNWEGDRGMPGLAALLRLAGVLGVPVESKALKGLDSLLSIAQMPAGIPVGTLAIGRAGAVNAALLAAAILATAEPALAGRLETLREEQTRSVPEQPEESEEPVR